MLCGSVELVAVELLVSVVLSCCVVGVLCGSVELVALELLVLLLCCLVFEH